MSDVKVISLGGSIIAPKNVDSDYLKKFYSLITGYLNEKRNRKLIMVCGGGWPAREYQRAFRQIITNPDSASQDWIGIAATRLNAELLMRIFSDYCRDEVVTNPLSRKIEFGGRILIASGWKPGFSTDYDAVLLAERFGAKKVINLSNIVKVYTDDPKTNPQAQPIDKITWNDFLKITGNKWIPGKNVPFDPVASKYAAKKDLNVIVADGKDIGNIRNILTDKSFTGTLIAD